MRRYFEFSLVTIIFLAVLAAALHFLSEAQLDAEKARVQADLMSIRAQLMERSVHRETFGGALPASANPMDWISDRPPSYSANGMPATTDVGVWYFDAREKVLVYRYRSGEELGFRLSLQGGAEIRGVPGGVGLIRVERSSAKVN